MERQVKFVITAEVKAAIEALRKFQQISHAIAVSISEQLGKALAGDRIALDTKELERSLKKSRREVNKYTKDLLKHFDSVSVDIEELLEETGKEGGRALGEGIEREAIHHMNGLRGVVMEVRSSFSDLYKGLRSGNLSQIAVSASRLAAAAGIIGGTLASMRAAWGATVAPAIEFEEALTQVAKTTGLAGKELQQLGDGLQELSGRLGISQLELAGIAEIAGQLGIQGREDLLAFTETVAKLSSVSELSAEDAAAAIARIANAFKLPIGEAERLGSVLNELSNTTTAKAGDIAYALTRIGNAGSAVGFTVDQVAALAATLIDAGVQVETAGTSLRNVFIRLQTQAEKLADVAGMTAKEFSSLVQDDALAALRAYLDGLRKLEPALRAIKIKEVFGDENFVAVQTLSEQVDLLNKNLQTSISAFKEGKSLNEEFARSLQSVARQWELLTNRLQVWATQVGEVVLPALQSILKWLNGLTGAVETAEGALGRIGEGLDQVGRLEALLERYNSLIAFGKENTDEFRQVVEQINEIMPGYVQQFDDAGRPIRLYTDALREAIRAQKALLLLQQKRTLKELVESYRRASSEAAQFASQLDALRRIQAEGGTATVFKRTGMVVPREQERQLLSLPGGGQVLEKLTGTELTRRIQELASRMEEMERTARHAARTLAGLLGTDKTAIVDALVSMGVSLEEARRLADQLSDGMQRVRVETTKSKEASKELADTISESRQAVEDELELLQKRRDELILSGVASEELARINRKIFLIQQKRNELLRYGLDELLQELEIRKALAKIENKRLKPLEPERKPALPGAGELKLREPDTSGIAPLISYGVQSLLEEGVSFEDIFRGLDGEVEAVQDALKKAREELKRLQEQGADTSAIEQLISSLDRTEQYLTMLQDISTITADAMMQAFVAAAEGIGAALAGVRGAIAQVGDSLQLIVANMASSLAAIFRQMAVAAAVALQFDKAAALLAASFALSVVAGSIRASVRKHQEKRLRENGYAEGGIVHGPGGPKDDGYAEGGPVRGPRYAEGGIVHGPGGPKDDRIPALLSNGEFVVNARATSRARPLLEIINERPEWLDDGKLRVAMALIGGGAAHRAGGGMVGAGPLRSVPSSIGTQTGGTLEVRVHVDGELRGKGRELVGIIKRAEADIKRLGA